MPNTKILGHRFDNNTEDTICDAISIDTMLEVVKNDTNNSKVSLNVDSKKRCIFNDRQQVSSVSKHFVT